MKQVHTAPFDIQALADEVERDGLAILSSGTSFQRQTGKQVIATLEDRSIQALSTESGAPNFLHCIFDIEEFTSLDAAAIGQSLDKEE
ncbi:hypothetical protein DB032_13560 [Chromobacterium sp. Panama]|uniref:hypothetical protein n=1 Tax=Chromobacterium sp. Panama TaxID=2161826 RepID=UPI000D2F66C1|nr:hypothetical protein [Chromobacterium sp. Panama]PTU65884.1 hypothetical protein DB032_13560 [Chromobacterium sp. Panama]